MLDLSGLPVPEGAPPEGSCVRVERPEPGVAVVVLDPPHRPKLAVLDLPVMRDLAAVLDGLASESDLEAIVFTGREPLSFAGGADVEAIAGIEDASMATRLARLGQQVFDKVEGLGRHASGGLRTVAAVGGPVPGGACELSLACDRIVLADDPRTRIGLPETKLGILPGWGGCQRLPRRIGVPGALGAILAGKLYPPRKALELGIVDRIVAPERLVPVAIDVALGRRSCKRRARGAKLWLVDKNPLAAAVIARQSREQVLSATRGRPFYPGPLEAAKLVVAAPRTSLQAGLEAEARALGELAVSPTCKSLVSLFFRSEEAKKLGRLPSGERARRVERGAVVGAGVMGGAIASLMAERGMRTRLIDLARPAVDAALVAHQREIARKQKRRRLQRHEAAAALDRLRAGTALEGLGRCELAVEAVAERLDVKGKVLAAIADAAGPDAILATNTSSLSVDAMANELPGPERVVGVHFFNPVRKMPLVEIVRGAATDDEVVARACRFALDLGKTPVVTKDVAGFLVNRLLGPYLDEAVRLYEAGADPRVVDDIALDFGMPMGPFELLDEVGLDIAAHAAVSLHEAYGVRMTPSRVLAELVDAGELGKKTGLGLYRWSKDKKGRPRRGELNPRLRLVREGATPAPDVVTDRLVLSMVNEAARCLEEEVVAGPAELDLATVFGMGFAPFRGGLLRYADARGTADVRDALARLVDDAAVSGREGGREKFTPAALLEDRARAGRAFHAGPGSPAAEERRAASA